MYTRSNKNYSLARSKKLLTDGMRVYCARRKYRAFGPACLKQHEHSNPKAMMVEIISDA